MAAEAGINIKLVTKEFATMLSDQTAGAFQSTQVGWSGRVDPDGNLYSFVVTGAGLNDGHYTNADVDAALNEARLSTDIAERKRPMTRAQAILLADLPIIYLWHRSGSGRCRASVRASSPIPTA